VKTHPFVEVLMSSPAYAGQIVHVHEAPPREARFAEPALPLPEAVREMLAARGIERLYCHQAKAIDRAREGKNVLLVTGTASGKSLGYVAPIIEALAGGTPACGQKRPPARRPALREDGVGQASRLSALGGGAVSGQGCPETRHVRGPHPHPLSLRERGEGMGDARVARTALLLFPTKALSQDQFRGFSEALTAAGLDEVLAGVYDGDTPAAMRRRLRDHGSVIFTNPDMLHAGILPQHGRWAGFLSRLLFLVIDELHVYNGIFGSNMANLMRRFLRVCRHYGSDPQVIACSATIGNPRELAEGLTGQPFEVIDDDGSPRGRRTYVFWNPPWTRDRLWRSRRSANVEAHELMAALVAQGVPTITFSKSKMTAEMIYRYVSESLGREAPDLVKRVSPYRGGYLPEERREIERRLFSGELLGVSTTPALELGIDVGGLDASVLVGYPGTLASFFQQSGRAGRKERDSLVVLVGLDTTINQYIMSHPDYLFGRPIEEAVIDPDNPYVITDHLRCATHELPLDDEEVALFGPHAQMALRVLEDNLKVKHVRGKWYHAASETPQHEISMRDYADKNVVIEDVDTGAILGEVNKFDAPPILHPEAIYMHQGDTYRVLELNLEKNIATVKRVEVDYYTDPLGGTDVHHVDHALREKPFGTGTAFWGEVTAYFRNWGYERIHFYELDAISRHKVDLPTFQLETMAFWLVAPEWLMEEVRRADLDCHSGLRGIGYATRMLLPMFMTCDTRDFSHSIGSANSAWNAIFIYERYPHGLGFTEKAYDRLHEILPQVLDTISKCDCSDGCPCCVGKPLRQFATWNVERHEAHVPSKRASLMILDGLLADGSNLRAADRFALTDSEADVELRLERSLRRRLERMREPEVFHPIEPKVKTEYPEPEQPEALEEPDVSRRADRRRDFEKELRKRIAKKLPTDKLSPHARHVEPPPGMRRPGSAKPPGYFPGRPAAAGETPACGQKRPAARRPAAREDGVGQASSPVRGGEASPQDAAPEPIRHGDALAAKARKRKKNRPG
jgi:DEAD/DEAH box helicase domain-containing protein